MNEVQLEALAKELNVDFETLKHNYYLMQKSLETFEEELERSTPTLEDYQIRVGGPECPCQKNDLP